MADSRIKCVQVLSTLLLAFHMFPAPCDAQALAHSSGLVVSVSGEVVIQREDLAEAALEGLPLSEGDTILVKVGGEISGFTPSGEPFSLAGPAQMVLAESFSGGALSDIAAWVRSQLAEWIGESRRQPLTTRAVRDWATELPAPLPLLPADGGAVRGTNATLIWSTIPGIDRYVVTLAPAAGEEIVRAVRGSQCVMEGLQPGAEYVWKVLAALEGWRGEARWRTFRVMTAEEQQQLDEALRGSDDLQAGVLLLSAGLHEEAVYRFDAVVTSPEQSRSARLWRARALAEIGLHQQAHQDLRRAWGQE